MKTYLAVFVVLALLVTGAVLRPTVDTAIAWIIRKWQALRKG